MTFSFFLKNTPRLTKIFLIFIVISFAGCASKPQGELFTNSAIQVDPQMAQIVIYNKQFYASANSFLLSDGSRDLAVLSYKSYVAFKAQPGPLELFADLRVTPLYAPTSKLGVALSGADAASASSANKELDLRKFANLNVQAGEQYFFQLKVNTNGFDTPTPELIAVDKSTAMQELKETKRALLPKK